MSLTPSEGDSAGKPFKFRAAKSLSLEAGGKTIVVKGNDIVPEAVGDTALQTGVGVISPRAKNAMIALDKLKKARAAYQEASGPPPLPEPSIPPEILSRMGMTEADFKLLPKEAQAAVSDLATRMQTASPSKPPPVFDRTGRVPTGNEPPPNVGGYPPGSSEPLPVSPARQLPAASPAPIAMPPVADTSGVIKGWQPTILDNPKLLPVLNEAGEHVAYAPAPAPSPVQALVKAAKDVVERHQQSTNPFLQDDENVFETAARAQKVPHFAQTLHAGDISAADMEKASDLGWDLATKKTNEAFPGSNHGIPSKESRELVIEQMKALEEANGKPTKIVPRVPESGPLTTNPKALAIAQELQQEMEKP